MLYRLQFHSTITLSLGSKIKTALPCHSVPLTMDSHAPTAPDENSCVLLVTVAGQFEGWVDRREAYEWASNIIRDAVRDAGTFFEGELRAVIPLGNTVAGVKIKLQFADVPEALMNSIIRPAFERTSQVTKLTADQVKQARAMGSVKAEERKKNARAIGDVETVKDTIQQLMKLRGDGGHPSKKQKFAENCANMLDRSQRVATSRMREMREDARDVDQ